MDALCLNARKIQTQTQTQMVMAEAEAEAEAEAAEAAEAEAAEAHQGGQENHHANQHKYPFKGSQDRRDVFKTEQLLRILPPMDSQ
jgi:hypothetical protein